MTRTIAVAAADGAVAGYVLAGDFWPWTPFVLVAAVVVMLADAVAARSRLRAREALRRSPVDGWQEFHRELARARRHARPLTLLRLPAAGRQPHALERLGSLHRRTDRAWISDEDAFVVLPEAGDTGCGGLLGRIREQEPSLVGEPPGVVVFPRDGLTTGALMSALYGQPLPVVGTPRLPEPLPALEPTALRAIPALDDERGELVRQASG